MALDNQTAEHQTADSDPQDVVEQMAPTRLPLLDALRGVAILMMISYHLSWDLEFFGFFFEPGTVVSGGWQLYARFIGSSFLFLAGFSLALAAQKSDYGFLNLRKRLLLVGGAAVVVSIATSVFAPSMFIYFGILHSIALASVVGFFVRKWKAIFLLILALACIALPALEILDLGSTRLLAWIGLSQSPAPSLDYYPLLPWLASFLFGMVAYKLSARSFAQSAFFTYQHTIPLLSWLGRNSLLIYLIHQPILVAFVSLFT